MKRLSCGFSLLLLACASGSSSHSHLAKVITPAEAQALAADASKVLIGRVDSGAALEEADPFGRALAGELRQQGLSIGGQESAYAPIHYFVETIPPAQRVVQLQLGETQLTRVYTLNDGEIQALAGWVEQ